MTNIDIRLEDREVFERLKSTGRITTGLRRIMTQQWNKCMMCGHTVSAGRPVFAGYGAEKQPLLLGACCSDLLEELATPVYRNDKINLSVQDSQPVWRYMDLAKFISMLQTRGLYFPRADQLDDPFEGAAGLARREADWDRFYSEYFRKALRTVPEGYPQEPPSEDLIEREAVRLLAELKTSLSSVRAALVSCWHANNVESEALWRLYCPPPTLGVAVRSTVGSLWDEFSYNVTTVVGRVHYLDFQHTFAANGIERIFCKRSSLSHENEIRVVLQNDSAAGKVLVCDLNVLIGEVVVSPFAPQWSTEVISGVIEKFGYSFAVRRSALLEEPFF